MLELIPAHWSTEISCRNDCLFAVQVFSLCKDIHTEIQERNLALKKKKKVSIMIFFEETMLLMIFSPPTYIRRYKNILYIFLNLEKTLALPTSIEKLWG